jgi:hypothetical protein
VIEDLQAAKARLTLSEHICEANHDFVCQLEEEIKARAESKYDLSSIGERPNIIIKRNI